MNFSDLAKNAPSFTGVYVIKDKDDFIIYIGKAKNIHKRLISYLKNNDKKTQLIVLKATNIQFLECVNEEEALLLEAMLVKKEKPRYNILLKDDKSFSGILLTKHSFPAIKTHRFRGGKIDGKFFGPFSNSSLLTEIINVIRSVLLLRNCTDSVFNNRTRPCIEYQIKRCTAPCVNYVTKEQYARQVKNASDFMEGGYKKLKQELINIMQKHAKNMEFEKASVIKDQITAIEKLEELMCTKGDFESGDVFVVEKEFVVISQIRYGVKILERRMELQNIIEEDMLNILIHTFIQFYTENSMIPKEIFIKDIINRITIENFFKKFFHVDVVIKSYNNDNRVESIANRMQKSLQLHQDDINKNHEYGLEMIERVVKIFTLDNMPNRIDVIDNSHFGGKFSLGCVISFTSSGFDKSNYRVYNLHEFQNDDYGMLESLLRKKIISIKTKHSQVPDLLLIDGGIGHKNIAIRVMQELNYSIPFICIAKGEKRQVGKELFFTKSQDYIDISYDKEVLFFLAKLRDEAHRFAITNVKKRFLKIK